MSEHVLCFEVGLPERMTLGNAADLQEDLGDVIRTLLDAHADYEGARLIKKSLEANYS